MEDTYHQKVIPRIVDADLVSDRSDSSGDPDNMRYNRTPQPQQTPVTPTQGFFTSMSANRKIALCIIIAIIIIAIVVFIVKYYGSSIVNIPAGAPTCAPTGGNTGPPQQPPAPTQQQMQSMAQQSAQQNALAQQSAQQNAQAQQQAAQSAQQQAAQQQYMQQYAQQYAQQQAMLQQQAQQMAQQQAMLQQTQSTSAPATPQTPPIDGASMPLLVAPVAPPPAPAEQPVIEMTREQALAELQKLRESELTVEKTTTSIADISQYMLETNSTTDETEEGERCSEITTSGKQCKHTAKVNGKCLSHQ